ncbi:hypothetical protein F8388_005448 [Cannabis sativa]|uniref:DYW domain-containing protein n=1 Tax=Cannabis sativa TaxID=3483 RepID=A0A7J6DWC4_CANSA|nr:hypothetical protein F8388_005448 [Cannabis sativa]
MAFSPISTAAGTLMRIIKNPRVCDNCHAATKLLSKFAATKLLSKFYGWIIVIQNENNKIKLLPFAIH